tara:strand:- start:15552 stop:16646 length:1095 start_codon:yes stop_codon:yes gene_type:complete
MSDMNPRLHWTQRIALVRHNFHAARRTNDFSFFKTLQAHALIEGTDHVALLYSSLGDNADSVLSTLDNLNAGIAYVHQDAFKAVYDGAKSAVHTMDDSLASRKALLRVDVCQQRDMADHAIDKTANSAINFIQAQPIHCQDAVANAWITGTTIIADAVSVCNNEMTKIEESLDDFIRLEYSWNCIQSSVDAAISALRGIFSLMAASNTNINFMNHSNPSQGLFGRNLSVSSASGSDNGGNASTRSRNSSTASAFSFIKRALSHAQMQPPPAAKTARTSSIAIPVPEANPRGFRASMSAACPTKMSTFSNHPPTILTTIPPTPAADSGNGEEAVLSPFKNSDDYFAFEQMDKSKQSSAAEDLLQL